MTQILIQAATALACVAAITVLAALGKVPATDAVAVISAVVGYAIHASGTLVSGASPSPKAPTGGTP